MNPERIGIPDVLANATDHALICTFGADLSFYEGPLWRQIVRARNRVVLADDQMLAQQLSDQASGGSRLRHINISYVASPITNPRSAHAKLILLADAMAGTLLVGSGNLGMNGYASRGEVFCKYEFNAGDSSQLAAFHTAKEFLDLLAARGYLDAQARRHIDQMWSDVLWIWAAASGDASPVRHNLVVPLANQLLNLVDGEPVTDVVVHAPFYDPDCEALRRLLTALAPSNTTVVLQERRTRVDPLALARALTVCSTPPKVRLAEAAGFPGTYLHAKFVLIRTSTRSISFVGSANLSLAGLYRTDQSVDGVPPGNIELVNLSVGLPDAFDELLAGLDLRDPGSSIADIDVRYPLEEEVQDEESRPRLQRGTWTDGVLLLEAAASLPDGPTSLVVAGADVRAKMIVEGATARANVDGDAAALLDYAAVPVWLRIETLQGLVETTPIYPYHPNLLAGMLAGRRDPDLLRKTGSLQLDIDDADLASVVDELDATLVIDSQSLWRLAARTPPTDKAEGEGLRLRWEDLDWEKLRRHPKLTQYERVLSPQGETPGVSDLQIVLASIVERFGHIGGDDGAATAMPARQVEAQPDFDIDHEAETPLRDNDTALADATTEEIESEGGSEEERQRLRVKRQSANRAAWQRFCDRFGKSVKDSGFIELVGPGVVVANAVVFNHLLALLVAKDVIEPARGILHQLRLWEFLWGDEATDGYVGSLDEETRLAAMQVIEDHGGEVVILSAVALAEQHSRGNEYEELRHQLRDVWRHLLESALLTFTLDVLEKAVRPGVQSATELASALDRLSHEWTLQELNAAIATGLGADVYPSWTRGKIHRKNRNETVDFVEVEYPGAGMDPSVARSALVGWAQVDREREYYRLRDRSTGRVAVWDRASRECWWLDSRSHSEELMQTPIVTWPAWAHECRRILEAARTVDQRTVAPPTGTRTA